MVNVVVEHSLQGCSYFCLTIFVCSSLSLSTMLGLYADILVNWQTQPTLLQDKHYPLTYSNDHNLRWNGTNLRNTFLHFQKKHSYHWLCLASHTYFILLLENIHVNVTRSTRPIDAKLRKKLCLWIMFNIKISLYQTPPQQRSKYFRFNRCNIYNIKKIWRHI